MNLCDEHKNSIVYEEKDCPLCAAEEDIQELQDELERARDAVDNHG